MIKKEKWVINLRKNIKKNYGDEWAIKEKKFKDKLITEIKFYNSKNRIIDSEIIDIEWNPNNEKEIILIISKLNKLIKEKDLSLNKALPLIKKSISIYKNNQIKKNNLKIKDFLNFDYSDKKLYDLSKNYLIAKPFPNIIIDDFLTQNCIQNTIEGFKKVEWASYTHFNEKKSGNKKTKFDPLLQKTIEALNSDEFIKVLETITGIPNLIADPKLGSGGVHRSTRGGFLNIHADFTVHPYNKNWHRRVNVLIYLNDIWEDNWGGKLEFWDKSMKNCVKKISPIFNRCVIFNTDYDSYHGHPEPMSCPKNIYRKSIALYYYTEIQTNVKKVATNYKSRPLDNRIKKILIFLDKKLLSFFHFLKSKFNISDRLITSIFDFFNLKK